MNIVTLSLLNDFFLTAAPSSGNILQVKNAAHVVCVRDREDSEHKRRLTTVELIVDERPVKTNAPNISPETMVLLRVDYGEITEGIAIRAAGGIWDGERKLWRIAYQQVEQLGMLDRIVPAIPEERAQQHTA